MLTFNGSTYVSNEVVLTKFISVYRMVWDLITAYTVRNKWEKLGDIGKIIYDTKPCWKYEKNPGSHLGSTS